MIGIVCGSTNPASPVGGCSIPVFIGLHPFELVLAFAQHSMKESL